MNSVQSLVFLQVTIITTQEDQKTKKKVINTTVDNVKTHAPEILEKLVEKAKGGDIKAIDLYMDMILQLAKNLDLKTDGRPIIQIAKEIAEKNNLNESNA